MTVSTSMQVADSASSRSPSSDSWGSSACSLFSKARPHVSGQGVGREVSFGARPDTRHPTPDTPSQLSRRRRLFGRLEVPVPLLMAQGAPDEELLAQGIQETAIDPLPVRDVAAHPVDRDADLEHVLH